MSIPPEAMSAPPPAMPSDSARRLRRPARRVRVLHVEDSPTTRLQIGMLLERAGFVVIPAATGEEGLRRAFENRPDIVLLDVQLPGIDGFEVCRRLRQRAETAHIPVLHLSETFVTAADRVRGIENGADWYLTQPIEPVELVATISALTRMHAAEESIRVQADDLAAMLATTTDGFWRIDRHGNLLEVNDTYCMMSGLSREKLLTMAVAELELDDAPHALASRIDEVMAAGFDRFESRHRGADGMAIEVEVTVSARLETGQLLLFIRDIGERKRSEEYLRRLATMVESSNDAIFAEDLGGRIVTWNTAAERLYGYLKSEIVGRSGSVLVPAKRQPELPAILRSLTQGERIEHFETVRLRKDGRPVEVSLSVSPLRDAAGRLTGATTIARDITARKQAEAEIRALNEQLEARVEQRTAELQIANRNLEAFTYSASHDLRTPLQVLSGFSSALIEDCGHVLDDLARHYAERIRSASENMAGLLDELLEFTRTDRVELRLEEIDLGAEAADIANRLRREQPDRQVEFVIEPAVHAMADRSLIRSVLENLLGNAWKFTSTNEQSTIEFGTMPAGAAVVHCYVRDDGAGFDQSLSDRLFQPFQRLHTDGQFHGTGIGLASVRNTIERHGGRTWAEGAVNKGATFHFTLPAGQRPPAKE